MLIPVLAFGLPLLLVAALAVLIRRALLRRRTGVTLASISLEETMSFFYGTKRTELDQRDSFSMMREEDAQGAPPDADLDLDAGTVPLRRNEN